MWSRILVPLLPDNSEKVDFLLFPFQRDGVYGDKINILILYL